MSSILYSLPFGKGQKFANQNSVANQIIGGWQVSTITTVQSGVPINAGAGWNSAGMSDSFPHSNRLHCVAGVNPVAANPTTDQYWAGTTLANGQFVPEAFRNPGVGEFGNCGRNNLLGSSRWNVDFSAMKDFRFGERHTLQFRTEMFNAPNHPNWNAPSVNFNNQNPTIANVGFGRIRGTGQLRQIQFALKYFF